MKFPRITVDGIVEIDGCVVLIKRLAKPFKGQWALPGGHVNNKESAEDAAVREVKEETGLDVKIKRLVGVYSDPKRNPDKIQRIAAAFSCRKTGGRLIGGADAGEAVLFRTDEIHKMKLAFDHNQILADYFKQGSRK